VTWRGSGAIFLNRMPSDDHSMNSEGPRVYETHIVSNQPPPLVDYDLFSADPVLPGLIRRDGADWAVEGLTAVRAVAWPGGYDGAGRPRQPQSANPP